MSLTVTDVSNPACLAAELTDGTSRWRLTWDSDDGIVWAETHRAPIERGWTSPMRVVRPERFGATPLPGTVDRAARRTWNAWLAAYVAELERALTEDEADDD